jgi:predicted nucleic acid-binding protein
VNEVGGICVDASFVLKLVLPEKGSDAAEVLWSRWADARTSVYAPGHLLFEASHGIRKAVRSGNLASEVGDQAFERLIAFGILLRHVSWDEGVDVWTRFVRRFDYLVTPYDAAYLYVADIESCELWTADERLVRTVGSELPWVRPLSEFAADHDSSFRSGRSGGERDDC